MKNQFKQYNDRVAEAPVAEEVIEAAAPAPVEGHAEGEPEAQPVAAEA